MEFFNFDVEDHGSTDVFFAAPRSTSPRTPAVRGEVCFQGPPIWASELQMQGDVPVPSQLIASDQVPEDVLLLSRGRLAKPDGHANAIPARAESRV